MYSLKMAFRSLLYRRKQYSSLFWVFAVGLGISFCAINVANGMLIAMNEKSRIYYGGNFAFAHSEYYAALEMPDYRPLYEKVRKVFPEEADVSYRFDLDARRVSLYFEGAQALQQTIKGCVFKNEKRLFKNMNFISGGIEEMDDSNGIIISQLIAESLNVKIGDEILIELQTYNVQKNTAKLIVKGIFLDSSVFGMYTSYMDFNFLKQICERENTFANRIVINFPGKTISKKQALIYQAKLEEEFGKENMFPLMDSKEDFLDYDAPEGTTMNCLIPLEANLSEVKILEKAMNGIISLIIVILAIIIITGIGSTYRVLIIKRINEVGIYMALGMKRKHIASSLLLESGLLMVAGLAGAIILNFLFCFVLSKINLSFITSMDMFLIKGNLKACTDVFKCVIVSCGVICFTLLAVLNSTWKSVTILPAKALASIE